ncbi:MAG: hypothetical protein ISS31_09350 [Kiritimatiellae bacterium]|nr:hypothetical protein [Kiritimatiellia bacterium]
MNNRERIVATLNNKPVDRLPMVEWASWWDKTVDRWRGEGLDPSLTSIDLRTHFGLDKLMQLWIRPIHGDTPSFVDEKRESCGGKIEPSMESYEKIEPYLFQILDDWPVNPAALKALKADHDSGELAVWFTLDGFYWLPRTLLGDEEVMYAFYDIPEVLHRINEANAEWILKIIDRICEYITPDFMTFAEDMSCNNGPMLSDAHFNEFMKPYYDKVVPKLKERGIKVFVDTDGDVTQCAPWFRDAGIEGMLPMEANAGNDIIQLRKDNPGMLFIGGFNKYTMHLGEAAMRKEFERIVPLAKEGGYIISPDHQTPPEVSLENYNLYLKLFKEYAQS